MEVEALAASEDNFQSKCCGTEGPVGPTVGRNQRKLPKKKKAANRSKPKQEYNNL